VLSCDAKHHTLRIKSTHTHIHAHRFTDNPAAATTTTGHPGSLAFKGRFYDNVLGQRKGVTSLSWAKPKLKFDVPDGFV
jgi:hypothetical protein